MLIAVEVGGQLRISLLMNHCEGNRLLVTGLGTTLKASVTP